MVMCRIASMRLFPGLELFFVDIDRFKDVKQQFNCRDEFERAIELDNAGR